MEETLTIQVIHVSHTCMIVQGENYDLRCHGRIIYAVVCTSTPEISVTTR